MKLREILIMICACSWLAGCSEGEIKEAEKRNDSFIVHFDQADLQRMEKFTDRFHDRKGDYVMAIPPIVDGGYWIYDLRSDGRKIEVMIDNTRDGYSSDRGQEKLVCEDIALEAHAGDGEHYTNVVVKGCDPSDGGDSVYLFRFGRGE